MAAINGINGGLPLPAIDTPAATSSTKGGGAVFGQLVEQVLSTQGNADATANKAIEQLATGQADNLHSVSLAVAQADLAFRLVLELRNRLSEAYQEVMRMQV